LLHRLPLMCSEAKLTRLFFQILSPTNSSWEHLCLKGS
jgi:hypothetical protein